MGAFAFRSFLNLSVGAVLLWSVPVIAQSLESYDAEITNTGDSYHVSLEMKFKNVGAVRYSILENDGHSLRQTVSDCVGGNERVDSTAFSARLFPAAQTTIQSGCGLVRISYEVPAGPRVPLLIPDARLAPKGPVT